MFSQFLLGTINQVTMAATLRRSNVYRKSNVSDKDKIEFREKFCAELKKISIMYKSPILDKEHIDNIFKLKFCLTKNFGELLNEGDLKLGISQKALNLYLKLLWSQGLIVEPPHCPIDSIIIKKLPRKVYCNWTEINDVNEYIKLIDEIRNLAITRNLSIAHWELLAYQE